MCMVFIFLKEVMKVKESIRKKVTKDAMENMGYIKELLKDNSDITFRHFCVSDRNVGLIYVDGLADKILLNDYVVKPMQLFNEDIRSVEEIKNSIISASDVKLEADMASAVKNILSGESILFIDGVEFAYIIATRSWPNRGVSEPNSETTIRGAREGFVETIRFNTALLRRRIRDSRLKLEATTVGVRSKTDVVITYIEDIVNTEALKELKEKIHKIDIDAVLDSSYISQEIEEDRFSPFPQIQSTERPDVLAAALYEGRIGVIVDNTPFVLIVPTTLVNLMQSPDDYYSRWISASFIRLIRFFSIFLSLLLPALYISVTSFHNNIIPTKFAYSIAACREGVPFPAFVETIFMEISISLLLEAVARLPKAIGATVGIVGGLIIGDAAVGAGIISPIMVIITGLTAITTFIAPNYEVTSSFRFIRIMLIILSSILGLYGVMIGMILSLVHLLKLRSFTVPYLAPLVGPEFNDLKDVFIRAPLKSFRRRPEYMKTGDKIRQK